LHTVDFDSLEPVIDPANRISFLLDWELTMKCNLDCSYCQRGLYGGHDNTTKHPPLPDCIKAIDFMFEYVDLYMAIKPAGTRYVILNVYGGESLHHPDIVEILQAVKDRYDSYRDRWHLTVTTTTNAIVSEKKLKKILPLIDEFTCSYHAENTDDQKQQFKRSVSHIRQQGKRLKCVIMMHSDPILFADAEHMIKWCQEHDIKYMAKQIDHSTDLEQFNYNAQQVIWLKNTYKQKSRHDDLEIDIVQKGDLFDLSDSGRSCCGGRSLCHSQTDKQRKFFVPNKFPDWFCSVNHFFLYIKQVNGEIYTNKDCKMDFKGQVSPIGYLDTSRDLIEYTRKNIEQKTLPVIQCKKINCFCGLCAPKARSRDRFDTIMRKYQSCVTS